MAHLRAPNLTSVPLPIPRSRTMSHTYTPAPSPSPSSLEAWRNKPKRVQGWSRTLPPPKAAGEMSWGKGVGVGSAEWSGTTAGSKSIGGGVKRDTGHRGRDEDQDEEEGMGMGMADRTDGGTEPTTFKNGRLAKSERAGEVVREQRRLGSQGSAASRSAPHLPPPSALAPIIIPAQPNTRPRPTPFLALPSPPPHQISPGGGPSRPVPVRSAGSAASANSAQSGRSARSVRDAYIEEALHIPIALLAEVQAEPRRPGDGEAVRKSKSSASQRKGLGSAGGAGGVGEVREARSGASAGPRAAPEGRGERKGSGVPLEPVKTWPRTIPRSPRPDGGLMPAATGLPARSSSDGRAQPPTPHQPQSRTPTHPHNSAGPSSSIRTAPSTPVPHPPPHLAQPLQAGPMPHRQPTPALRPALSRGGSIDAIGRRQRDVSATNLQARLEANTYPLPMSGTTTSKELSPVRLSRDERPVRAMGSTASKARMPIRIELDPTLTPGSSTDRRYSLEAEHHPTQPSHHRPRESTHVRVTQPFLNSPDGGSGGSVGVDESPGEEDRISFEIPSSGRRGRLRVSLAWFRDVRSPRRWKEKIREREEVPPRPPSKDQRWAMATPRSPPRARPHSPGDFRPARPPNRSQHRERADDFLIPPEVDRDRVRFSPVHPEDMRSPTTPWATQQHTFPQPTGPGFMPHPASFPPLQQRQGGPFPSYPQPLTKLPPHTGQWPNVGYPLSAIPPPPNTQLPLPPASIDPPSETSPPIYNRPVPSFYPSTPHPPTALGGPLYPQSLPYGLNTGTRVGQNPGDLSWTGRPTMWQRMFSQRSGDWEGREGMRPEKEGWIRNWRSGVHVGRGGTTFIGGGEGREWWRFRGRRDAENAVYPEDDFRQGAQSRRGRTIWPFTNTRPDPTRVGTTVYPPPTYPTPRQGGTGIFSRPPRPSLPSRPLRPSNPTITLRPVSPIRPNERAKEERRAQRKERRDRRDEVGDGRTLHPFDSVTSAGQGRRSPAIAQVRQGGREDGQGNMQGMGRGGSGGGRVGDWVRKVSAGRNTAAGAAERRERKPDGAGAGAWKERLKTRGVPVPRGLRGRGGGGAVDGVGVGGGGKLRRVDSKRQDRGGGADTKRGLSLTFGIRGDGGRQGR